MSQAMSYEDLGLLFSESQLSGTARFKSMAGAFGALGGDLAAMEINPAGGAVFKTDEFGFSLSFNEIGTKTNYYGTNSFSDSRFTDFEQSGFVSVTNLQNINGSAMNRFYLGFNYTKVANYDSEWTAEGNSSISTWSISDPFDENIIYDQSDLQYIDNFTEGSQNRYSFFTGGRFAKSRLYIGAGLKVHDLNFRQSIIQQEFNSDGGDNYLDTYLEQWQRQSGNAISLNLGFIVLPTKFLRIGLAYESPTWWNIQEESNLYLEGSDDEIGYYELIFSSDPDVVYSNNESKFQYYEYQLNTPSKVNASAAIVIGKFAVISADYLWTNFQNLRFEDRDFFTENANYRSELQNTATLSLGTEWRFGVGSIRAGYRYTENPYKNALKEEDLEQMTVGFGLNFRHFKIDVAYQIQNQSSTYDAYPDFNQIEPVSLEQDFSKITTSFLIRL